MSSAMANVETEPDLRSAMQLLTLAQDGDEFIIGRADLGIYVAVPKPGAVLIEALRDGASLARASELASDAAGEEVDANDFLAGLREAGLLDTQGEPPPGSAPAGTRMSWVERIPQAYVRPLFGRVAWAFYAATAIAVIVTLVLRPDVRPIFDDVWFLTDPIGRCWRSSLSRWSSRPATNAGTGLPGGRSGFRLVSG